jgi:DNA-binding transcriptional MerR regulator
MVYNAARRQGNIMIKIKAFAQKMGVSIRMLRHYDQIGLLQPESVTEAGYRLYGKRSERLMEEILLFKELEFPLEQIVEIIYSPNYDRDSALKAHKELIRLKQARYKRIDRLIDSMLENKENKMSEIKEALSAKEIKAHQATYAQEAEQKWGESDAYKESQKRYKSYSDAELEAISKEQGQIYSDLATMMERGVEDDAVQAKVHEAREFITKYWYECSVEMFEGLGQMYIQDARFTKNIDKFGEGLAQFLSDAIDYYVMQRV